MGEREARFLEKEDCVCRHLSSPCFGCVDGKVVGFMMGYVSGWEFGVPDTVGWIDTLGVDPAYQRRGVGRALFNALIENFKRSGREKTSGVYETENRL
ncbi:MAG: GNAT family N-acetyltransferase [Candidatus Bathyarchaeia archaeon]